MRRSACKTSRHRAPGSIHWSCWLDYSKPSAGFLTKLMSGRSSELSTNVWAHSSTSAFSAGFFDDAREPQAACAWGLHLHLWGGNKKPQGPQSCTNPTCVETHVKC